MTDPAEIHDPGVLRTLLRGLALLEQVIIADGEATAKSLGNKVALNKSSCYQMLKTLELAGYAVHTPAGSYAVGARVPAMFSHLRAVLVPEPRVARALNALRDETGDTSHACALRGHTILLQAVAEGRRALVVRMLRPGMRENIHARASCRAILSQLGESEQNRILPARFRASRSTPPRSAGTCGSCCGKRETGATQSSGRSSRKAWPAWPPLISTPTGRSLAP